MTQVPDPLDARDLVPITGFQTRSEAEVVLGLLKSSGIQAVFSGRYHPKVPRGNFRFWCHAKIVKTRTE